MTSFFLELNDLLNFKKMMKNSPKLFAKSAAHVLNDAAFGVRDLAIKELRGQSIVRNEKFLTGSIRVDKARLGRSIADLRSEVGSIKRPRFTGWEEQETGSQKAKREYFAKIAARRKDKAKQIIKIARLKGSGRFPKPTDFRVRGGPLARAAKMVHILSRSGFTKPFIIFGLEKKTKGKKPPPGLYRFGSGVYPHRKLTLLQRFKSPKPTKKAPWLSPAVSRYLRSVDLRNVWGKAVNRELRKYGMK